MDAVIGELQCEQVVVEEFILIRLMVGSEDKLFAVGRPIDGMLVEIALGKLVHLFGSNIRDKNVQSLIVIEACEPFARVWLVQIARDDHGVAVGFSGAFTSGR